jgi:adenosylmethionine-8-amino-7-oxononanoate aminotransferase
MRYTWHPCSQMKDYETLTPITIDRAEGSYLYDKTGKSYIDAISSWWCKSLGHQHPRLKQALIEQTEKFEHVILANSTNEAIENLSKKLCDLFGGMDHVFYGGDGSTAVEIAVKMSLHAHILKGNPEKKKFLALKNGYHGETIITLALSDLGIYKKDYVALMPDIEYIAHLPYISSIHDEIDLDSHWKHIETQLESVKHELSGIVFEPIVQGAGGMLIYHPEILERLSIWSKKNDVHLIADEIMTGFYRTGKAFASHHAGITPDMVCVSKGLTSGWLAMSCVLTNHSMYELFYDDYEKGTSFLHSNTYSGNALAVAVANEAMNIYREENIEDHVSVIGKQMLTGMQSIRERAGLLKNVRQIGAVCAAEISFDGMDSSKRYGFELFQVALKNGLWLRPLGNTIYWLPPLNSSKDVIEEMIHLTEKSMNSYFNKS